MLLPLHYAHSICIFVLILNKITDEKPFFSLGHFSPLADPHKEKNGKKRNSGQSLPGTTGQVRHAERYVEMLGKSDWSL